MLIGGCFIHCKAVSLSIERKRSIVIEYSRQPSVGLSVCMSVCLVCVCLSSIGYCGKTADWIWMRFGMVGRTGPGMRQIVEFGNPSTGRGNFGSKYGAPHCNQWELFTVGSFHCAAARLLLAEFLELQARRAGEECRVRRSNAAILPRDRGQTCFSSL